MGAGQSANGPGQGITVKTSYYTLLAVEKSATDDEIKKAYRRKALELHPDRNYGKEDDATSKFAEIQAAYEVLSDPQERAWYDSHEGAILRGDEDGDAEESHHYDIKLTTSKDVSHLMGSFYGKKIDYDNVPTSFFNILRDFFDTLAEEEARAAKMEGLPIVDYPSFGEKNDTYEDVAKPFYATWNGFSTEKTYFWEDRYRYSEAPDRRVRRMMEKENKKLRDEAIREFDNSVRSLVAFVRKRDPRYQPNFQTDADRQKALRDASAAQAARSRAANAVNMKAEVPEWAQTRAAEDSEESSDEEIVEEHYECVACHKTFKSEKQFEAHEKSKKHQKSVYQLKKQMQKENDRLDLGGTGQSSGILTPMSDNEDNEEGKSDNDDKMSDSIAALKLEEISSAAGVAWADLSEEDESDTFEDEGYVLKDVVAESSEGSSEEELGDEYASRAEVTNRLTTLPTLEEVTTQEEHDEEAAAAKSEASEPKLGKAAQKRAKRAAKQAAADQEEAKHMCANCSAAFPSRAQLFRHITDFGHAAPVPQGRKTVGKKKGKK